MLRDWLITLAVLSPTFLAVAILVFVVLGRIARHKPIRATSISGRSQRKTPAQ
jgi:hypothetical protein